MKKKLSEAQFVKELRPILNKQEKYLFPSVYNDYNFILFFNSYNVIDNFRVYQLF